MSIVGKKRLIPKTIQTVSNHTNTASGTWLTILNLSTISGMCNYLAMWTGWDTNDNFEAEITIDGGAANIISSSSVPSCNYLRGHSGTYSHTGAQGYRRFSLDIDMSVRFESSILVRVRQNTGVARWISYVCDYGLF